MPINAPNCPVHSYNKDAAMTFRHAGSQPVYAPNSYGGPRADPGKQPPTWWVEAAELGRYAPEQHAEDDDFGQAGTLVREVMSATDVTHLAGDIVAHAGDGVADAVQRRVVSYWSSVDRELGAQVADGLALDTGPAPAPTTDSVAAGDPATR